MSDQDAQNIADNVEADAPETAMEESAKDEFQKPANKVSFNVHMYSSKLIKRSGVYEHALALDLVILCHN